MRLILSNSLLLLSLISYTYFFLKYSAIYDLWLDDRNMGKKEKWHKRISEILTIFPAINVSQYFWKMAEQQDIWEAIISYIIGIMVLMFFGAALRRVAILFAQLLSKFEIFSRLRVQE